MDAWERKTGDGGCALGGVRPVLLGGLFFCGSGADGPTVGRFEVMEGFRQLLGEFGVEDLLVVEAGGEIAPKRHKFVGFFLEFEPRGLLCAGSGGLTGLLLSPFSNRAGKEFHFTAGR